MSAFEAGMIVCFGISWPVAVLKTLKTRSVQGKSRMFLLLVLAGYGLGILHKIFFSLDLVLLLYLFNFSMVLIELCLWFRYHERPVPLAAAVRGGANDSAPDRLLGGSARAPALAAEDPIRDGVPRRITLPTSPRGPSAPRRRPPRRRSAS